MLKENIVFCAYVIKEVRSKAGEPLDESGFGNDLLRHGNRKDMSQVQFRSQPNGLSFGGQPCFTTLALNNLLFFKKGECK